MTNKKRQKRSSVRVILSFLAFVVVCIYTPILIDDMIRGELTVEQRILQGTDPASILEATSSGGQVVDCSTSGYLFGSSMDGYAFVHKLNTDQYAVEVSGVTRYYLVDRENSVARPVSAGGNGDVIDENLSSMLENCKKSGVVPTPVKISFAPKK
mgnify:CR=1 FL=1